MTRRTPEQQEAAKALLRAIVSGKLPKAKELKCVRCGNQAAEYHHYLGYAPRCYLTVQPLCRSCHRKVSIELGEMRFYYKDIGPRLESGNFYSATRPYPNMITCKHGLRSIRSCVSCRKEYDARLHREARRAKRLMREGLGTLNPSSVQAQQLGGRCLSPSLSITSKRGVA